MGASQNNTGSQSGGAPSSQSGSHLGKKTNNTPNVYNEYSGVPWWLHGLRIRCCHCSGLRRCGGTASIPGPGTPTWHSREWGEEATLGQERIQEIHTEGMKEREKPHLMNITGSRCCRQDPPTDPKSVGKGSEEQELVFKVWTFLPKILINDKDRKIIILQWRHPLGDQDECSRQQNGVNTADAVIGSTEDGTWLLRTVLQRCTHVIQARKHTGQTRVERHSMKLLTSALQKRQGPTT